MQNERVLFSIPSALLPRPVSRVGTARQTGRGRWARLGLGGDKQALCCRMSARGGVWMAGASVRGGQWGV
jgi:hypothetical protein